MTSLQLIGKVAIILFATLILVSGFCRADQIELAVSRIAGITDEDNPEAPYNRLLDALLNNSKFHLTRNYYPTVRSNYLLEDKRVNCIFPIAKGAYRRHIQVQYSEPVNSITTHLFSLNSPPYEDLQEVANEVIVYIRGYLFGNLVKTQPHNVTFVAVDSTHKAIELLASKRAKAYLEYMPDLRFALTPAELSAIQYSPSSPIQVTEDVFECYRSEQNKAFLSSINESLAQLKVSGKLQEILGDYYNL